MSLKQRHWLIYAAIFSLVGLAMLLAPPRTFVLLVLADFIPLVLLVVCTTAMIRNAIATQRGTRHFWILMASGFTLWTVNQVAWVIYEVILHRNMPDPFFGDIILFMHVVPLIAAVVIAPHQSGKEEKLHLSTLNFLMILAWWVFLYAFVVFPDEYVVLRVHVYVRSYDLLYTFENLAWLLSLAIVARNARAGWRRLYGNLFAAAALYAVASETMNAAIARGVYYSGSIYDLLFLAALYWFMWTALQAKNWDLAAEEPVRVESRWPSLAPRLVMLAILSLPAMGLWALIFDSSPLRLRNFRLLVMLSAMLVLGAFVFLKQYLLDHQLMSFLDESDRSFVNLQRIQTELVRKEKLASLGQLVAGAAHEINNPLTAILGYAELLSSNPSLSSEQLSMAQKIGHHARRTRDLIFDLLSFAQQTAIEKSPVDLGSVLQKAMQMEILHLESKNIRVETRIQPGLPRILGNSNELFQCCLQIIANAADALQEVGGGILIASAHEENGEVVLQFSDSGPGIREPGKVFDPFYTTKPVGKGTGLGLSAAYGVVQNHQGQITCCNKPEGGALFTLRFPALAPIAAEGLAAKAKA